MSESSVVNNMFEEILDESAKACKEEQDKEKEVTKEEQDKAKLETKSVLTNFLKYIKSVRFTNKIDEMSKKYDVPKKIIKNHFIAGILGKIADILHLTIAITAEIIKHVFEFIGAIINKIVDFAYEVCLKITNLLTLNCGSMA